jgi:hypothetical protein
LFAASSESLFSIANDRDMDTNSVFSALTVLLQLWENKATRSWVVDEVLGNQTLQCEVQQLARGIVEQGCVYANTPGVLLRTVKVGPS